MKNVLIADDTKNIRLLLTKCLELEGYNVLTASDGQEALALLKNEAFDLAFLDIKMPQLSGTEVLKRIRELGIDMPVIIITAYATVKNAVECTQMGAVAYLQKPFTADKVRSVLNEIRSLMDANKFVGTFSEYMVQIEKELHDGQFSKAVELLKKAISIEPADANIYLQFGKAYQGLGDQEKAEKFLNMFSVLSNEKS